MLTSKTNLPSLRDIENPLDVVEVEANPWLLPLFKSKNESKSDLLGVSVDFFIIKSSLFD